MVAPLRLSHINSGTFEKTEQTNISVIQLTDTQCCLVSVELQQLIYNELIIKLITNYFGRLIIFKKKRHSLISAH